MHSSTPRINWDIRDSPYHSVLNTNYIPSSAEESRIKAFLAQPEQALVLLEFEITRLLSERDKARVFVDAHRMILSPARRLPVEILAEVFQYCMPSNGYPVRSTKKAPLLLLSVCKSWREIAISLPQLWNALHVYLPENISVEDIVLRTQGADQWLSRSGSKPLSISVAVDTSVYKHRDGSMNFAVARLLHMLMTYGHRLEELAVDDRSFSFLPSTLPEQFNALKVFSIRTTTGVYNPLPSMQLASLFSKSPALIHFSLSGFRFSIVDDFLSLGCRWDQLRELNLDCRYEPLLGIWPIGARELQTIFEQTHHLQLCRVVVGISGWEPELRSDINLPYLRTLSLVLKRSVSSLETDFSVHPAVVRAIRAFAYASLESLCVVWNGKLPIYDAIFSATSEHLRLGHLRLCTTMGARALTESLTLLPNLRSLEIIDLGRVGTLNRRFYFPTVSHLDFVTLSAPGGTGTVSSLCPLLTTFRLVVGPSDNAQTVLNSNLLGLIERKCSCVANEPKLEICEMVLGGDLPLFSDEAIDKLRKLKQEGLQLSIQYMEKDTVSSACDSDEDELELGLPDSIDIFPSWARVSSESISTYWPDYRVTTVDI